MINELLTKENKAIVRSFYEGGTDRNKNEYGAIFHPGFTVTAPRYLPWGGTSNLADYLTLILPQVTAVLDFSRFKIISLIGENSSVVIVIEIGLMDLTDSVRISEHWEIEDGKAFSLWVAYFEAFRLIALIKENAAAKKIISTTI
ncbi:MAG TPA: hypothetical protein VK563_19885 [Puia sp.]|nr:hypothetical protein [Puia sp.]